MSHLVRHCLYSFTVFCKECSLIVAVLLENPRFIWCFTHAVTTVGWAKACLSTDA